MKKFIKIPDQKDQIDPLWILTSPRSGSTFLGETLNNLLIENKNNRFIFMEHFNIFLWNNSYYSNLIFKDYIDKFNKTSKWYFDLKVKSIADSARFQSDIINEITSDRSFSENRNKRIINKKFIPKYNKVFPSQLFKKEDFKYIKKYYSNIKFIQLIRKDILEQTISQYLAELSGIYVFYDLRKEKINEYMSTEFQFDLKKVLNIYKHFEKERKSCIEYFEYLKYLGCPIHKVFYEDLRDSLEDELYKIYDFLSLSQEYKNKICPYIENIKKNKTSRIVVHPQKKKFLNMLRNSIK